MTADLSVIMPLYNCEQYVEIAIGSLLENADGLLEVIVVDDGSTDRGPELAAAMDPRVRVISQENAGPSAARNRAIREARGDVLGFLDADDIWVAGSPDPRRELLADGADVAFGWVQVVVGDPPEPYRGQGPAVQLGTILVRRSALDDGPLLDESLLHGEDVDWIMRMRESGLRAKFVEHICVHYRLRPGSLTRDRETSRAALPQVLGASLKRRGKIGGSAS